MQGSLWERQKRAGVVGRLAGQPRHSVTFLNAVAIFAGGIAIGHRTCRRAADHQAPLRSCSRSVHRLHVPLNGLHAVKMPILFTEEVLGEVIQSCLLGVHWQHLLFLLPAPRQQYLVSMHSQVVIRRLTGGPLFAAVSAWC